MNKRIRGISITVEDELTQFSLFRVNTNDGILNKQDKIRLKYYDSCRKMALAENRRRASVIQEEEGEATPLLANNPSISNQAEGFLVSKITNFYL